MNETISVALTKLSIEGEQTETGDAQQPTTLTSFSLFPNLPQELQDKIWKIACASPRIVAIKIKIEYVAQDSRYVNFISPISPCSALLLVSQDARLETLRAQTLHHKPEYGEKRLYFNCEKDILWYNGLTSGNLPAVMQLFGKGDIKKIRKIAMDWLAWFNLFKLSSQNKRLMVGMRILWLLGVEEVFVLVGPANAHQGYAYESRWGSFEPATEIDPANERCYWQDLRKVLVVPDLTVASLEAAFRDKAMEVRKERLAEMDNLIAEGKAIEADLEADGKYKHLGGREPWTVPNIRFVEVNMST